MACPTFPIPFSQLGPRFRQIAKNDTDRLKVCCHICHIVMDCICVSRCFEKHTVRRKNFARQSTSRKTPRIQNHCCPSVHVPILQKSMMLEIYFASRLQNGQGRCRKTWESWLKTLYECIYHLAAYPPSTDKLTPVIHCEASLIKNATVFAISDGNPKPNGCSSS